MNRIGSKVKTIREIKGITQKQLAKAIGVSEKYIEELESGKRIINDEVLKKVSKVLEQDESDFIIYKIEDGLKEGKETKVVKKVVEQEPQKLWSDAFDFLLKTIPIYEYDLVKTVGSRQMAVVSNKIDGYPKDKVLFIQIQDNDMIGFRMVKDDIALGYLTSEIENNAVHLIEFEGQRIVRQIKRLDKDKVLFISNNGRLITETVQVKEVKVLVRLVRLEIKL